MQVNEAVTFLRQRGYTVIPPPTLADLKPGDRFVFPHDDPKWECVWLNNGSWTALDPNHRYFGKVCIPRDARTCQVERVDAA